MLNQATVLIKMKRTSLALKTLETLFSNIMLLEEPIALKTCTLLLEVYINLFRGNQNINGSMTEMQDNAAKVIDYLEKYAETGKEYTEVLKKIITQNNLTDFDDVEILPTSLKMKNLI